MSDIVVFGGKKKRQRNVGSMAETLKDLALDEVEESQSQMRTDAQTTLTELKNHMHKESRKKNRREHGPQCTDF